MPAETTTKSVFALAGFLAASFGAAAFGAMFPPGQWYEQLTKPAWNPPAWVFGPVWSVLYLLIGVSGWMVWMKTGFRNARGAFAVYFVQLVLNAAWSCLFFGLHRPGLAFAEIVLLWSAIAVTVALFWRIRRAAGALMIPYLLWVGFAVALNWKLWQLNR